MSGTNVDEAYEEAKRGAWDGLLVHWKHHPKLAVRCSRYQKITSGWTFLHQAAYFGHEAACRELIRLGCDIDAATAKRELPADIAAKRNHSKLAALLQSVSDPDADSLWRAPSKLRLLPSSNRWSEALERRALHAMEVAYGGGSVKIPKGSRYYVDAFERTLIGWHGTFDPPCGMTADSMLD